jgi:hypothetical protein
MHYIQRSELVNPATAALLDRAFERTKAEHGAANSATPCHLGIRRLEQNLRPERLCSPDRPFEMDGDASRCRHGGSTVSSGVL